MLVSLMSVFRNEPIPLYQCLIEIDINFLIKYVIKEWFRRYNNSLPKTFVILFPSNSILESISLILNGNESFLDYNNDVFNHLNKKSVKRPYCLILLDFYSIIKFIKTQNYLIINTDHEAELSDPFEISKMDFYIKCLIVLNFSNNFNSFKEILSELFILLKSKLLNIYVKEAIKFFKSKFQTIDFFYNQLDSKNDNDMQKYNFFDSSNIFNPQIDYRKNPIYIFLNNICSSKQDKYSSSSSNETINSYQEKNPYFSSENVFNKI